MWDHSALTSAGQMGALRLLSEWLDASRRRPAPWRLFRTVRAADGAAVPETPRSRRQGTTGAAGATS